MKVKLFVLIMMFGCSIDSYAFDEVFETVNPEKNPKISVIEAATVSDRSNDPYIIGGHHFFLPDSNYNIYIKCNGTGRMQPFYDLTSHAPKNAPSIIFLNADGDSLIANIYVRDKDDPSAVVGVIQKFAFALDDINYICGSTLPFTSFYNNLEILKNPKTDIQFEQNPVNGNTLSFSFVNPEALSEIKQIAVMDIEGTHKMDIPLASLLPVSEIQSVDVSQLKNGIYFVQIITPSETKPFKFVIAR